MANAATAELTLSEECYSLAEDFGFSKRELGSLKRALAKRSDAEIFEALCRISGTSSADSTQAVGTLYSLTETQLSSLEAMLKTIQGWD